LTITGQPAASAEAVSPPATENANGKLLAPNTATGPSAIWRSRKSTRGSGFLSGCGGSMRAPTKSPSLCAPTPQFSTPLRATPDFPPPRQARHDESRAALGRSCPRDARRSSCPGRATRRCDQPHELPALPPHRLTRRPPPSRRDCDQSRMRRARRPAPRAR